MSMPCLGMWLYMLEEFGVELAQSGGSEVKLSAWNSGDQGSIPGSGRSPGEGNGHPLKYSWLENPMDRGAWWAMVHRVTKSQTRLKQLSRAQHTRMYVYVHLTHFAVYLKLTHYKSNILQSKKKRLWGWAFIQSDFSSVSQSCPALCDPMGCSTSGFPVHHQLPEFTQTHVHWLGDAIQPSHPLSSPSLPALNLSQHQGLFQWVSSLHQVTRVLEFQLQPQSFQWIFRVDFLKDWLVWSPCSTQWTEN